MTETKLPVSNSIPEVKLDCAQDFPDDIVEAGLPTVLKGYVANWPIVEAALKSPSAAADYISSFYNKRPVHLMQADSICKGRLFYNEALNGFNFTRSQVDLSAVMQEILATADDVNSSTRYVGSTAVDHIMPGFRNENDIEHLSNKALISIWIGNQSRISAHYDAPDNIACVVAGKRRFTLFPPEQIENLYVGPLDFTPAGQSASLVDFHKPDYARFPKFKEALKHAFVAELEPGDAIYIPSMWWHHVESLAPFNILINYWWRQVENFVGVPNDALYHALLSIKSLPKNQRQAWKHLFDHYVFEPDEQTHIPDERKGILSPLKDSTARQLRAMLINKLNR
ncbi:cupin-like domain-containing protein [Glaciecola sp. MF2-115]|uniref:cupin-like domain-containing protein n=1 Tax=Glaciecola sp. MF2-115 TaxID=3384827 RepID=UPI0039A1AFB1